MLLESFVVIPRGITNLKRELSQISIFYSVSFFNIRDLIDLLPLVSLRYTLYRGIVPVLQSLCASNFVYFYTFHGLKELRNRRNQTAGSDLLLASIAGIISYLSCITEIQVSFLSRNGDKEIHVAVYSTNIVI